MASPPMFKPNLDGKYIHPWLKPLPGGRAKVYDLLYRTTATALAGLAAYGLFEVGRGCYYIARANQPQLTAAGATETTATSAKVQR